MKNKILNKATELFINLGFKSVTMDEIAASIGVSKKTIYAHFNNKTQLVEETTLSFFRYVSGEIDGICALEKNPIEEIFDIKRFVISQLKYEKSSPQYQLQKYYPKIFNRLKEKKFEVMHKCVMSNLNRGIHLGLYRKNIDVEFITRIYIHGTNIIKDIDVFPLKLFSQNTLTSHFLDYHLRGICTEKGIKELENQQNKN